MRLPLLPLLFALLPGSCDSGEDPAAPAQEASGGVAIDPALAGGRELPSDSRAPAAGPPSANRFDPGAGIPDAELGRFHPVLHCAIDGVEQGSLVFDLWPEAAPITVRNFLRLCDTGFYDGVPFHRILRDFMVQGGDPTGTGTGNSPYGTIRGEFSTDPARRHGYGVISMARMGHDPDSASCQFFVCCNEGHSVWGLDGSYASFGRLTAGVATLEALAMVPVEWNGQESSRPKQAVKILKALVREGEPPREERIARPAPDLGDEPRTVVIQHLLISFQGAPQSRATRSREEALQLADELLERARAGEDFDQLIRAHSDAPRPEQGGGPSTTRVRNHGVLELEAERAAFELAREAQAEIARLNEALRRGEIPQEEVESRHREFLSAFTRARDRTGVPRGELPAAVGELVFSLGVGEIGRVDFDAEHSPMGWHLIRRQE
jgi:peptidyl-prolyl cis-trans isomerase B (cyclophilin B)